MDVTILILVALLLVLATLFFLFFQVWATFPRPERRLVDTYKVTAPRLAAHELRGRTAGQFAEMGFDTTNRQPAVLSEEERFAHVLNVGRSGVGKTTYFLSTFIWRDIANHDNSVVIFDGQHDLTEPVIALCKLHRRPYVVFPDAGFNPLGGQGSLGERVERFADLFAQAMEIQTGSPADFYTQRAQIFIRKIVPLFERVYARPMTLQELLYLTMSEEYRERLVAEAGVCPEGSEYVGRVGAQWGKSDFEHNLSGLQNFLDRLLIGPRQWLYNQRDAPSLEQAIENKQVILIREGGEQQSQARTLGLIYMLALQSYVRKRAVRPNQHPVWVYADEAHMYFNATFPTLIATARKKRVGLHLGFQNFAQFQPFTETVSANASTWIVHGGLLHEDAQFVADQIGRRVYHERSISHAPRSPLEHPRHSESVLYDYLLQPEQIRGLPGELALVLSVAGRETQAARLLRKPTPLQIATRPYVSRPVPPHRPKTIWDEEDEAEEDEAGQTAAGGNGGRARQTHHIRESASQRAAPDAFGTLDEQDGPDPPRGFDGAGGAGGVGRSEGFAAFVAFDELEALAPTQPKLPRIPAQPEQQKIVPIERYQRARRRGGQRSSGRRGPQAPQSPRTSQATDRPEDPKEPKEPKRSPQSEGPHKPDGPQRPQWLDWPPIAPDW